MTKIMWVPASFVWFILVFWVTFRVTFPSEHVSQWLVAQADQATEGAYELEMGSVSPWWVGLSAENVSLWGEEPEDPEALDMPVLQADSVYARVGLFSVLARAPYIETYATMGEATIEGSVNTTIAEGQFSIQDVDYKLSDLDLMKVLAMAGTDGGVIATGRLNGSLELDMSKGVENAKGKAKVSGEGMNLVSLSLPTYGITDLELDVPIDALDIKLKVSDGLMEVSKGEIQSGLADIQISGDIQLNERLERSRVRLKVEMLLNDWTDTPLAPFRGLVEGAISSAKWADGRYHYDLSGTVERYHFLPDRESRSRSAPSRSTTARGSPLSRTPAPTNDADRSAALRDRLRSAAAARGEDPEAAERPTRTDDSVITVGGPDDEELYDDEELDDEGFDDELSDEELEREFEEMFEEGNLEDLLEEY